MNNKIPILVVGQAAAPTGFSRVQHSILEYLKDKYEIHHFGSSYFSKTKQKFGWTIYRNKFAGDPYGLEQLVPLIERIKPKLIFIMQDPWFFLLHKKNLEKNRQSFKIVAYSIIDSEFIDPKWLEAINLMDKYVVPTNFAKKTIVKTSKGCNKKIDFDKIEIIPHGINHKVFYPYINKQHKHENITNRFVARKILYPDKPELMNAFIVLNANRNSPRKRIDITIEGFSLFVKGKPQNVKLYLHMGMKETGCHILQVAKKNGIEDRLIFTSLSDNHPSVSDKKLNLIYNACDVGVNTSSGEGWGLVSFEHAATCAAQIVPKHSACIDIWKGSAILLEPIITIQDKKFFGENKVVSPEGLANALETLYQNRDYLTKMSMAAYKNVKKTKYQWKFISRKWDTLFGKVLNQS